MEKIATDRRKCRLLIENVKREKSEMKKKDNETEIMANSLNPI